LTTAPAGSTSIFRRPPDMPFTRLAKSWAYSWKMSLAGQVDCQRMVIGDCATEIIGKPSAAAPAVPAAALLRKERRDSGVFWFSLLMIFSSVCDGKRGLAPLCCSARTV
jgi:hypothetical protein